VSPRRILVLGCAGTGKTSFSRKLARRLGAPHICLDEIWRPGWGPDNLQAFRDLVRKAHAGDAWVSDGNFAAATFDLRLPLADLVLWLERPTWRSRVSVVRRLFERDRHHTWRKLPDVLRFIAAFDRVNRPRITAALDQHGPRVPVRRLRSRAEEAAFVANFEV
jgi:adenylate kinase family enzyme